MSIDEFNGEIKKWATDCVDLLHAKIKAMNAVGKKAKINDREVALVNSIYYKVKMEFGTITRVSFGFKKHGVFVHYGLAGQGGVVKVAERKWWTEVMNEQYDKLAELAADYGAELVADRMTIQFNSIG